MYVYIYIYVCVCVFFCMDICIYCIYFLNIIYLFLCLELVESK